MKALAKELVWITLGMILELVDIVSDHMTYFEVVMVEPSLADYRAANGVVLTGATISSLLAFALRVRQVFIILQVGTEPADGSQKIDPNSVKN